MTGTDAGPGAGMKLYVTVWLILIVIVATEVALTYAGLGAGRQLAALLALALLEAALGVAYFMHLRWERRLLTWSLIPYLALMLVMLNHLWRDAARMISLHP
jgi:cytochrome c oxidase subunit 4